MVRKYKELRIEVKSRWPNKGKIVIITARFGKYTVRDTYWRVIGTSDRFEIVTSSGRILARQKLYA